MTKNTDLTVSKQSKYKGLRPYKKGQSGNPDGRPVGSISVTSMVKRKLQEIPEGQKKTYLEILVSKILQKAIVDGDQQLIRAIWAYSDGMPRQGVDIVSEEKEILTEGQIDELLKVRARRLGWHISKETQPE